MSAADPTPVTARELLHRLPPRQRQVADRLLAGRPYKRISSDLMIAISTVAAIAQQIYEKFQVRRRDQLIEALQLPPGSAVAIDPRTHVAVPRQTLVRWGEYAAKAEVAQIVGSAGLAVEITEFLIVPVIAKKTTAVR